MEKKPFSIQTQGEFIEARENGEICEVDRELYNFLIVSFLCQDEPGYKDVFWMDRGKYFYQKQEA